MCETVKMCGQLLLCPNGWTLESNRRLCLSHKTHKHIYNLHWQYITVSFHGADHKIIPDDPLWFIMCPIKTSSGLHKNNYHNTLMGYSTSCYNTEACDMISFTYGYSIFQMLANFLIGVWIQSSEEDCTWTNILGCIQNYPDWVDNDKDDYNNKHSLRSNTKDYGGKTH